MRGKACRRQRTRDSARATERPQRPHLTRNFTLIIDVLIRHAIRSRSVGVVGMGLPSGLIYAPLGTVGKLCYREIGN